MFENLKKFWLEGATGLLIIVLGVLIVWGGSCCSCHAQSPETLALAPRPVISDSEGDECPDTPEACVLLERVTKIEARLDSIEKKLDDLAEQCKNCDKCCPCGPDCTCKPGDCPDNCPPKKTSAKKSGRWVCDGNSCRWVEDPEGTSPASDPYATPSHPRPAGDGWQYDPELRRRSPNSTGWWRYGSSAPVYSSGGCASGSCGVDYSYSVPVYSGGCASGNCGSYSVPSYGYSYGGGCSSGNCGGFSSGYSYGGFSGGCVGGSCAGGGCATCR